MDLQLVKNFLRVDFTDDDKLIELLILGAIAKMEEATGKTFNKDNPLHTVVCLKIISINYKVRDGVIDKKSLLIPRFIESDLFKIKYS